MKTIKLPIKMNIEDSTFLNKLRSEQTSVTRSAYKLFKDKKLTQKQVRDALKKNKYPTIDSWFIQCGVMAGKALHTR